MKNALHNLQKDIQAEREQLIDHPLYTQISHIQDIRVFMEHHIYAVWDFMSLLKALQRELTCVNLPWVPKGDAKTRWLINEIVTGEESDVDEKGKHVSHFELYLEAMDQSGASTIGIKKLLQNLQEGQSIEQALIDKAIPKAAAQFMNHTFKVINSGKLHIIAAAFTFGREDLIPDLFTGLVAELNARFTGELDILQYYLERHIEVDGGQHGSLAHQMLEHLCLEDPQRWNEATLAAKEALQVRIALWDAIAVNIKTGILS